MNILGWLPRLASSGLAWFLLGSVLASPSALLGQQPAGAGSQSAPLPDSPRPKQQGAPSSSAGRTSPFMGYITNKSFIFPDIATNPGPLSAGGKFKLFINESVSPPYVFAAGIDAAIGQADDIPKKYGQGWDAYGGRFGMALARASSSSFFGTFLFASLLRQDPRFFPQTHPTFWGTMKYSAQRVFITRTDSGKDTFNASGLLGPLASEGLANVYLPPSEQTGAKTAERYGTDLAWRFAGNVLKNYWPAIFRDLGLKRLKLIPEPGTPEQSIPRQ